MKETMDIDHALEQIPMGLFQYRMLLMCGFAFMADALEVNLLSYLATCAGAEWHLSNTKQASITGVVFAGIIVGSLWWGVFADRYGRKVAFVLVSTIITAAGFVTGAANSFTTLLIIRSIVGFGLGGASVPFDLLAEFMPSSHRGHFLIYIEYFWTFGSMFVTGLAWLCLDQYGWKVLAILTAIPVALTSLLSIIYLPESPRWLLANKKDEAAVKIIQQSALVNGHSLPDFSLHPLTPDSYESATYSSMLLDPAMRKVCIPLAMVWMIFGFTYYGVILFISRIFSTSGGDDDNSNTCSFDYSSIFYNSISELGGVTISAIAVGTGRVRTQSIFYLLSGITVLLIGFVKSNGAFIAVSFLARMTIMTASVSFFTQYFLYHQCK
jgi:MFS family permease